jgi:hypothetical protein
MAQFLQIPAKGKTVLDRGTVQSRFYETGKWLKVWCHDKTVQVRAKIVTSFLLIPTVSICANFKIVSAPEKPMTSI